MNNRNYPILFEQKRENRLKKIEYQGSVGLFKKSNISINGVSKGEEEKARAEKVLEEKMARNFPSLARNRNLHVQKANQIPNRINLKTSMPLMDVEFCQMSSLNQLI